MSTRTLFERLDRVGCQVVSKEVDEQEHKGRPSIDVDGDLQRGVTLEKRFHDYSMSLRGGCPERSECSSSAVEGSRRSNLLLESNRFHLTGDCFVALVSTQ